jgi:hypothetical protein
MAHAELFVASQATSAVHWPNFGYRLGANVKGFDFNEDFMSPHRANIINLLNLIASESDQLMYQKQAPVNVANELVNQWFDDFYHPKDEQFRSEFSDEELASLEEFDAYYDARDTVLPNSLDAMLKTKTWREVMALAGQVLDEHGWRGIEMSYDDSH